MPGRRWRGAWRLAALGLAAAACESRPAAENALLVTVDTLRADAIGPYGGPFPTPGFERLAREGLVIEGACTPTPSTGPAHASLLTGLHPWNHGILRNATPLGLDLPNLAVVARKAGFDTAAFVSSYVVTERFFGRGFRHFHFAPSKSWRYGGEVIGFWSRGEETTDAVLAWLAEPRQAPFLVWAHYFDPHSPYSPPPDFERPRDERIDLVGKSLPSGVESFRHLAALVRAYRGEVGYVDRQIERLLEGLDRLGLGGNTAVLVTSDHGEGLGDHGWLGHGRNLHDELVVVPLLARIPGRPGGRRLAGPAQLEDLMPTTLALLGLPIPEGLDGVDLSAWLAGEVGSSPRQAAVGQRASYPDLEPLFFERRWPDKWIGPPDGGGLAYRLDADPREAGSRPEPRPERLGKQLAAARERQAAEPALDEESRRALEALGYLGPGAEGIAE